MSDFDDLRVFERVTTLRSFSAAARALDMPKASVSRAVGRLEARLGVRLLQRTTRAVAPTDAGEVLYGRSRDILARIEDTFAHVGGLNLVPRGRLRISAGIGFGINVLSDLLPIFTTRYPEVDVTLDLTSRTSELVADSIDVAIRMGPLPASSLVATRLGHVRRWVCASSGYLDRHGTPKTPQDLHDHDIVEMPGSEGRPRAWVFTNDAGERVTMAKEPRIGVNDPLTIHRLVRNGAGIGGLAGFLCAPDIAENRLVRVLPDWRLPTIDVHIVFPSTRDLSPAVRAFVELLKASSAPGCSWQDDDTMR